jgi:hypothetical protein
MNKRYLHHLWRKLQVVNPWLISILLLLSIVISIYSLRQNNLTMVRLRDAVYKADEQEGDVETALKKLREHVYSHMNTDLTSGDFAISPPIQLKYRYERLLTAERERLEDINAKIYADAQAICEQKFGQGLLKTGRVPCVQAYVAEHSVKEKPIPEQLYKFDFISPKWSPDLAGWSLVLSTLLLVLFLTRIGLGLWLKQASK